MTSENSLAPDLALKASQSRVIHGGCRCGDVAYRITGCPFRVVSYDTNLFVAARQFRWVRGENRVVSYRLPGPTAFATAFCRRCGNDLPRAARGERLIVVPAASLDSDAGMQSQDTVCAAETARPVESADSLPQYAEMPPVV